MAAFWALDRAAHIPYKEARSAAGGGASQARGGLAPERRRDAQVAQLVEQRTENPRVGGSIPPLGTILPANSANHFNAQLCVVEVCDDGVSLQVFIRTATHGSIQIPC